MIIEYLIKRFGKNEDLKYSLLFGLIFGLLGGLIFGLLFGLIFGLLGGLIFDLGYFINFFAFLGLASLISHYPNFIPLWALIGLGIIIAEVFFFLDKQKPKKKQNKFWFTALKKGEAFLESIAVLGYLNLGRLAIEKIIKFTSWKIILKWTGYIGAGIIGLAIAVGIIYLYIKLNSLKYKK